MTIVTVSLVFCILLCIFNENGGTAFLASIFWVLLWVYAPSHNEPKAIDVYQNKTELKLTYQIVNNDTIKKIGRASCRERV